VVHRGRQDLDTVHKDPDKGNDPVEGIAADRRNLVVAGTEVVEDQRLAVVAGRVAVVGVGNWEPWSKKLVFASPCRKESIKGR
jgi:hypothetical protein